MRRGNEEEMNGERGLFALILYAYRFGVCNITASYCGRPKLMRSDDLPP